MRRQIPESHERQEILEPPEPQAIKPGATNDRRYRYYRSHERREILETGGARRQMILVPRTTDTGAMSDSLLEPLERQQILAGDRSHKRLTDTGDWWCHKRQILVEPRTTGDNTGATNDRR